MNNILTLRGIVLSKYKTIGEFADDIGWKRTKASRIINGIQDPTIKDIQNMTKCLEINSTQIFLNIFFNSMSTMWID